MSRHTPRILAVGLAGIGLAGALAGCAAPATTTSDPTTSTDTGSSASPSTDSGSSDSKYKDGNYSEDGSYTAPSGTETVTVKLTLKDDTVTALTVKGHATAGTQKQFQDKFVSGIKGVVVGKKLDDLASVARVAGSSLTSGGFKAAIKAIKSDAA